MVVPVGRAYPTCVREPTWLAPRFWPRQATHATYSTAHPPSSGQVVDCMKNSAVFARQGPKLPSAVLLCGPPGTGKTLLGASPPPPGGSHMPWRVPSTLVRSLPGLLPGCLADCPPFCLQRARWLARRGCRTMRSRRPSLCELFVGWGAARIRCERSWRLGASASAPARPCHGSCQCRLANPGRQLLRWSSLTS